MASTSTLATATNASTTPRPRRPLIPTAAARKDSAVSAKDHVDVAIIGGGPGGLAAAKAVLTARPELRVAVFERAMMRPRGAAVSVAPNGIKALAAIDPNLSQAVLALDSSPDLVRIYSPDGTELSVQEGQQRYSAFIRERGGPLSLCAWHALQSSIAASLPQGVLRQQAAFERYEETSEGVTLHFQGGSHPPVQASLLVGTDGGQSAVRAQCLGDDPPVYADAAIWRSVLAPPSWWPQGPSEYLFFGASPTIFTAYKIHDGNVAWMACAAWPEERLDEIGGRRAPYIQDQAARVELGEARRRTCLEVYGGWSDKVVSLIQEADPLSITLHGQFFRRPEACQVWGKGRVTLAGDAAHLGTPVLAQGSSQAFEDAVALGRAIAEHGPTPDALRAYEQFRRPQVEAVHRTSVNEFLARQAGETTRPEHEVGDELGVWRRSFPPLRTQAEAAA